LNSNQHKIGFHLRLKNGLTQLIREAIEYEINHFQFFPIWPHTGKYIKLNGPDFQEFMTLRRKHFGEQIFLHSSYWINPSSGKKTTAQVSKGLLKKESKIAKALEIKYIVLHAGTATGFKETPEDPFCKAEGIEALARQLNCLLKNESDVQILLENTAHGNKSIGGCFSDFALLKDKLDHPEKIGFCLDTAHAFAFGHNLIETDAFIETLNKNLGLENIKLIHLNDSEEPFASKRDKHRLPGQGLIGSEALKNLIYHSKFESIPKIIEPTETNKQVTQKSITEILNWK